MAAAWLRSPFPFPEAVPFPGGAPGGGREPAGRAVDVDIRGTEEDVAGGAVVFGGNNVGSGLLLP